MSWVRYDDGFDSNPKVTSVIAQDPGAIALHILANTWSNRQKRPGFVPNHQPGLLVGDRKRGKRWADLLEGAGLWHPVEGGWEFHDHKEYRASEKRQTSGTPAGLSAKRAEAGRRGGHATQQTKQTVKQTAQQNEQDVKQVSSKPCSPVVSSSLRSELTPEPVPPTAAVATPGDERSINARAQYLAKGYVEGQPMSRFPAILGVAKRALIAGHSDASVAAALRRLSDDGRSVTVETLRVELEGLPTQNGRSPSGSTTDQRVGDALALAARYRAEGR